MLKTSLIIIAILAALLMLSPEHRTPQTVLPTPATVHVILVDGQVKMVCDSPDLARRLAGDDPATHVIEMPVTYAPAR
jgi:hypothetical protein